MSRHYLYSPRQLKILDAAIRVCPHCDRRVLDWKNHQCVNDDEEAA